jgi:hypothetical protein
VTCPPGLTIFLPLECSVRVWSTALRNDESDRLWSWIASHPALIDLVARALELAEETRAA